jgi:AmmeMemoRadiSam system protein A
MTPERADLLLRLARAAIADALRLRTGDARTLSDAAEADRAWLEAPGASFVTLTQAGELRGCIGSLEAQRALSLDVRANARAAALHDPRFPPLAADDYALVAVEVSVLSTAQALSFDSEHSALAQLRPGEDGLIFEYGARRSTFLPQVWEQLRAPREFLAHLKRKAGLPSDFWADEVRLSRYTVDKCREARP